MLTRCLLFLVFAVSGFAAPRTVRLKLDVLELKNGHKLQDVLIWNYDEASGKVVLHVGQSASTIPFEFLPDDVAKKVSAQAKASGAPVKSEKTGPASKATDPSAADKAGPAK